MPALLIALGITVSLVLVSGICLTKVGVSSEVAIAVSSGIFGLFVYIHQTLEKKQFSLTGPTLPKAIVRFDRYVLSWQLLALYGALIFFALSEAVGFFGGVAIGASGIPVQNSSAIRGVIGFVLIVPASFLVGQWIGTRCDKLGGVAILISIVGGFVVSKAATLLVIGEQALTREYGTSMGFRTLLTPAAFSFYVVLFTAGMLGYWRGRRSRLSRYLGYLLRRLHPETQHTIVNLAYEEAARLSPNAGP